MDSSSLINIEKNMGIRYLKQKKEEILLSEKVAYEVAFDPRIQKNDPLRQFVLSNPEVITQFQDNEAEEYLRILTQKGIDAGEASAMAIALNRGFPLVIDERNTKAKGKANNHGIKTLSWSEFCK
ncbi:MAG TPA: hypothetical protein ACFYD6_06135 [Candidatus Brocadiia bacterium]